VALLQNLFVYGSLLRSRDGKWHPLLHDADFLGEARVEGRLFEVAGYPGMVLERGSSVRGELYRLRNPELALQSLDEYEEFSPSFSEPSEYRRVIAIATTDLGKQVNAWVYLYNWPTAGLRAIPTGDYRQFLREQR